MALWYTQLSQSNATKCTRELLQLHGFDSSGFTEKSLKVQGVTDLLDKGKTLENVMVYSRCWQTTTPLHYRNLSMGFLQQIAAAFAVNSIGAGDASARLGGSEDSGT